MSTRVAGTFHLIAYPLLLGYVCARAACLAFTPDESTSYLLFARPAGLHVFPIGYWSTNNHWLTTIAMKMALRWVGDGEFALRISSLLAYAVFLLASAALMRGLVPDRRLALGGWIVINTNPYLLDFFSLARGYGPALACLMLSLYLSWRYFSGGRKGTALAAVAVCTLGLAAHLGLMTYSVSLAAVMAGWCLYRRSWKLAGAIIVLESLAVLAASSYLARVGASGYWWFDGGQNGFVADTVMSLVDFSLYGQPYATALRIPIASFILLSILLAGATVFNMRIGGLRILKTVAAGPAANFLSFVLLVEAAAVLSLLGQHYLLGLPYPFHRMALYLIPLASVTAVLALSAWPAARPLLGAAAVCSVLHLTACLNLSSVMEWRECADTRRCVGYLTEHHGSAPVIVAAPLSMRPSLFYYKQSRGLDWLHITRATHKGEKIIASTDWQDSLGADVDYYLLEAAAASTHSGSVEQRWKDGYVLMHADAATVTSHFDGPVDGDGWSTPETTPDGKSFVWMDDRVAHLNLELQGGRPYHVSLHALNTLAPDVLDSLSMRVGEHSIPLRRQPTPPAGLVLDGTLPALDFSGIRRTRIELAVSRTVTDPVSRRPLAVAFDWICLREVSSVR